MTDSLITSTRNLVIGQKIMVTETGQEPRRMIVSQVHGPGTGGESWHDGNHVTAHIRPGGYSISFNDSHLRMGRIVISPYTPNHVQWSGENNSVNIVVDVISSTATHAVIECDGLTFGPERNTSITVPLDQLHRL